MGVGVWDRVQTAGSAYWGWVLAVLALGTAAARVEWVGEKVAGWIAQQISIGPQGALSLSTLAIDALGALTVLLIVSVVVMVALAWRVSRHDPDAPRLRAALSSSVDNARRIVDRFYPTEAAVNIQVEKAAYSLTVDTDGDGLLRRSEEVSAVGRSLHYWQFKLGVEEEATAAEYLEDITFGAEAVDDGCEVAHLLLLNEPRNKVVGIFHLPELPAEAGAKRTVNSGCYWPGMMKRFVEKGSEEWTWRLRSAKPIPLFEFRMYYHPKLGGVKCELSGKKPPHYAITPITAENGWPGYLYRSENAPAEPFEHTLKFTRELKA
jgi:hypothetical protein